MANQVNHNAAYFNNQGAFSLNQQKSGEIAEVRENLLHYPPFQALLESCEMSEQEIRRVSAAPSASGTGHIILTFRTNDPSQTRSLEITPNEGPLVFQAAQFLAGLDVGKPVFPKAPPAEEEEADTPPRNLHAPRTDPIQTLENRITAAAGSQGNDALLKTIVELFKEFTSVHKSVVESMARNMHCYSHGHRPAPSDEPLFDSSAFNFNPGPDSNSRSNSSGPIRHHTNRSAKDSTHPYARTNNLNNNEPYQQPPAFNPASDPNDDIVRNFQNAIRELQEDHDRRIQSLELRNQSLQQENQDLNQHLIGANGDIRDLLANISEKDALLQNSANELQARTQRAEDRYRQLYQTSSETHSELQSSLLENEKLREAQLQAQNGFAAAIQQEQDRFHRLFQTANQTITELQSNVNDSEQRLFQHMESNRNEKQALDLELSNKNNEIEHLQGQLFQLEQELATQTQALQEMNQELSQRDQHFQNQIQSAQLATRLLEMGIANLSTQIAQEQDRFKQLSQQFDENQQRMQEAQLEHNLLEERMQNHFQREISEITAQNNTLSFQNDQLQSSLNRLEWVIQQERDSTQQKLQTLNQAHRAEIQNVQIEIEQGRNAIAQLNQELEILTDANLELRHQALLKLNDEVGLQQNLQNVQSQNSALQTSQNMAQNRINELESQKAQLAQQVQELERRMAQLKATLQDTVGQLAANSAPQTNNRVAAELDEKQIQLIPQQKKIWKKPPVSKHMSVAEQLGVKKKSIPKMMALPKQKDKDDEENGIHPVLPVYVPMYRPSANPTGNSQSGSVNLGRLALKGLKKLKFR